MQADKRTLDTLADIRSAIKEVDALRTDRELGEEEREELELSAVALRDAERLLIDETQTHLVSGMKAVSKRLSEYSSALRTRVRRLNRTAKTLDAIEQALSHILKIADAIGEWR